MNKIDKFITELSDIFNEKSLIEIMYKYHKTRIFILNYELGGVSMPDLRRDVYIEETKSYILLFGDCEKHIYGNKLLVRPFHQDDDLTCENLRFVDLNLFDFINNKFTNITYKISHGLYRIIKDKLIVRNKLENTTEYIICSLDLNMIFKVATCRNFEVINDVAIVDVDGTETKDYYDLDTGKFICNLHYKIASHIFIDNHFINKQLYPSIKHNVHDITGKLVHVFEDEILINRWDYDNISKNKKIFMINPLRQVDIFGNIVKIIDESNEYDYTHVNRFGDGWEFHTDVIDHTIVFINGKKHIIKGCSIPCNDDNILCIFDRDLLICYDTDLNIIREFMIDNGIIESVLIY